MYILRPLPVSNSIVEQPENLRVIFNASSLAVRVVVCRLGVTRHSKLI